MDTSVSLARWQQGEKLWLGRVLSFSVLCAHLDLYHLHEIIIIHNVMLGRWILLYCLVKYALSINSKKNTNHENGP